MAEAALLCLAPAELADHVISLVGDAGIEAAKVPIPDGAIKPNPPAGYLAIIVPPAGLEKAKSVVALVLPQLLEPPANSGMSDRLARHDDPGITPLPVWRGPNASVLDEDESFDDDDYTPPEPPPVPAPRDLTALLAWIGAIGGPIVLIVGLVLGWDGLANTLSIAAFFAGFGVLIWRYERRHNNDDDFNNGAVV